MLLYSLGLGAGCEPQNATEIIVRVRSDLARDELSEVRVAVHYPDGSEPVRSIAGSQVPFTMPVGPIGSPEGEVRVHVTAERRSGAALVSEAVARFVPGTSGLLDVVLRNVCAELVDAEADWSCGEDRTCGGCGEDPCIDVDRGPLPRVAPGSVVASEPLPGCGSPGREIDAGNGIKGADSSVPLDGAIEAANDARTDGGPGIGDAQPADDATVTTAMNDCGESACVQSLSLGESHGCAVTVGGLMHCWGGNDASQLGRGDSVATDRPHSLGLVPGHRDWVQVSASLRNTCGVKSDGYAFCWGAWLAVLPVSTPQLVLDLPRVKALDAADEWASALGLDGEMYVWGTPPTELLTAPLELPRAPEMAWMPPLDGKDRALLLDGDGNLWLRAQGSLAVHRGQVRHAVARGPLCIVALDGRLMCSGANGAGQAGVGSTAGSIAEPGQEVDAPGVAWQRVAGWSLGTCGLSTDAEVWCWGDNSFGAMGVAPSEQSLVRSPRRVLEADADDPLVNVQIGAHMACAVHASGRVDCWGGAPPMTLGHQPTPLRVPLDP